MSKAILALLVGCVVIMGGCTQPKNPHEIMRLDLQAPHSDPKALAVYLSWFGAPNHMNVGYSSQDAGVLRRQIQNARTMGISGFVVDWYGNRDRFVDKAFATLERVAAEQHFPVALMYDETNQSGEATDDALAAFDKAYDAYIGPQAPYRDAYLTFNGRPVVFIFPKQGHTDWNRVRDHVNDWSSPPLLFYKDQAPPQYAADFAGYYPWVHPHRKSQDGGQWGQQYLQNFYEAMRNRYPQKIMIGAAWPGFDDSHASWGLNRYINARCGKTLEDTLQLFRRYDDPSRPAPFLLIETWNDYEEGTAVERPELSGCGRKESSESWEGQP